MLLCLGGCNNEDAIKKAEESEDVSTIQVCCDCVDLKVAYIFPQSDGFLLVRDESGNESGGDTQNLPQFLKVKLDNEKSCKGDRYYFSILEGPYVKKADHWDVRSKSNSWSVKKIFKGKSTLVEENPHKPAFAIEVNYTGMSMRGDGSDGDKDGIRLANSSSHGQIAVASVTGELEFKGKTTDVVMELDIIPPNTPVKVAIPDTVHAGGNRYVSDVPKARLWMRLDAPTSSVKWTDHATGNDRYLHFGRGSAGCFTNRPETKDEWNAIIDDLSASRMEEDGLYVGTLQFNIQKKIYDDIESKLKAYAKSKKKKYIWNNNVVTP